MTVEGLANWLLDNFPWDKEVRIMEHGQYVDIIEVTLDKDENVVVIF